MVFRYLAVPWHFGAIRLIWREEDAPDPQICRVFLPMEKDQAQMILSTVYAGPEPGNDPGIDKVADDLARYLAGQPVTFDLAHLELDRCQPFRKKVLLAEYAIPRGRVSTYGRIAERIGHPKAARAVGTALAQNPFPILIPCHRAVRADGKLGGYAGGLEMKVALLGLEGVTVDDRGRVSPDLVI